MNKCIDCSIDSQSTTVWQSTTQCGKCYKDRWKRDNPLTYMIGRLKSKCKEYNIPFDLDKEYLNSIITSHCPIFGFELDYTHAVTAPNKAHLDRIIPDLGYTKGNVVYISARANRIKQDATAVELITIGQWLARQ